MAKSILQATRTPACIREDRAIFRALRIIERRAAECGPLMSDADTARQFFRLRLGNEKREHFEVAFLNNQNRLMAVERLFSGTIDSASVHVRVVVQRAMAVNAAAVIVAHNHPSGDPTPSLGDKTITRELRDVLALVQVRLLDHIVVGPKESVSFAALGIK